MGIGLVDPVLPSIARGLDATASQVSLLFTSYFLITAVAMPLTGFVSSRIGGRWTLLLGLAFAGLAGTSDSVGRLVGFRAGRGPGNALFVSTALAVIVGAAAGGSPAAILLYESAPGLGMACGPPLGAVLGDVSRRHPFFGTATLMAIGFLCITSFLKEQPRPARQTSVLDPLRALRHGGLATAAVSAFFYTYTFFTVPAFTPFVLDMTPYRSGAVFFAWGVPLAADVLALGYGDHTTAVVCTILSGALIGVNNTVYTEPALGVPDAPRPVASAGYDFLRRFAAAAAPYFARPRSFRRPTPPRTGPTSSPTDRIRPCVGEFGHPGPGAAQSSGTDPRAGSLRSVPCPSQRSWRAWAPCTRFQAASFGVIGSSGRNRTGSIGASSSRSSTSPPGSPTRTEVKGAPGHSGSPTSSEAPGVTTRPSTCGVAASTASGRSTLSVSARPARTDRTSSARGPSTGSASIAEGSVMGCRDMPRVAYRTTSPSWKRSTSKRSVPRKVTAARASGSPSAVVNRASTRGRTSTMHRA